MTNPIDGATVALLISALIPGLVSITVAFMTARQAASKEQFEALRQVIDQLHQENERLIGRVKTYEDERRELTARVDTLEDERRELRERVNALECELEERDGALQQVKDWAELLVSQLQAVKIAPVAMPERKRKAK